MIQYSISKARLENRIEQEKPGWLTRAGTRTATFRNLGHYDESSSIWSEIKKVFMRLQHGKCAYCERQLETGKYGRIEHDMEHFRPKKKARPWKATAALRRSGVVLTPPAAGKADPGYHLLAYHPQNYCTSCKTCNSRLKNDHFPIEGSRSSAGEDPASLSSEKPLLVNPVGDFDDPPEVLIAFSGLSPFACGDTEYRIRRGLVTIAFFKLDDRRRKSLFQERARTIVSLHSFLGHAEQGEDVVMRDTYTGLVEVYASPSSPHSNCANSYRRLYQQDRAEADEVFRLAAAYLNTISP